MFDVSDHRMVIARVRNRAEILGDISEQLYYFLTVKVSCIVYFICVCYALLSEGFCLKGSFELSVEVIRRDACYRVISLPFRSYLW